jgi:hypothetical protein
VGKAHSTEEKLACVLPDLQSGLAPFPFADRSAGKHRRGLGSMVEQVRVAMERANHKVYGERLLIIAWRRKLGSKRLLQAAGTLFCSHFWPLSLPVSLRRSSNSSRSLLRPAAFLLIIKSPNEIKWTGTPKNVPATLLGHASAN